MMGKYFKFKKFKDTQRGKKIILTDKTVVGWTNGQKDHYVSRGYGEIKQGQLFAVFTVDLPPNSTAKIQVKCPVCDEVYSSTMNRLTMRGHSACPSCSTKYDLTGMKFGRLTAIKPIKSDGSGRSYWLCSCDCGENTITRTDGMTGGTILSCGCIHDEYLRSRTGENHPRWVPIEDKPGKRDSKEYTNWVSMIHKRDKYVCLKCGGGGMGNVAVHHLNSYAAHPEQATDLSNGATLCVDCHANFHYKFMGGTNNPCTKEDFFMWLDSHGVDYIEIKNKIEEPQ